MDAGRGRDDLWKGDAVRFMQRAFMRSPGAYGVPAFPASGLLAYYKLYANAQDASGNGNHATSTSAITYSGGLGAGVDPGAMFVNATPSYLMLPTGAQPAHDYTFAAWVKPSSLTTPNSYAQIWADWSGSNKNFMLFMSGSSGALELYNGNGSTAQDTALVHASALSAGALSLVIATRAGSTLTLSVNAGAGVSMVGSRSGGATGLASRIGADCLGYPGYGWGGLMSRVGIWGRALSGAEKIALYNAGAGLEYP